MAATMELDGRQLCSFKLRRSIIVVSTYNIPIMKMSEMRTFLRLSI